MYLAFSVFSFIFQNELLFHHLFSLCFTTLPRDRGGNVQPRNDTQDHSMGQPLEMVASTHLKKSAHQIGSYFLHVTMNIKKNISKPPSRISIYIRCCVNTGKPKVK